VISSMSVIVIGVGNSVLTDDSVGLQVVGQLAEQLHNRPEVITLQWHTGGIGLMEVMSGHDKAIIIDAIVTEGGKPGTIYSLGTSDLLHCRNVHSTHDASLAVALELGRLVGLPLPEEVKIWAIEAGDVSTFSETLTQEVARAVPSVVGHVFRQLEATRSLAGEQL